MDHEPAEAPQKDSEEVPTGEPRLEAEASGVYMNGLDSAEDTSSSSGTPTELWDDRSGEEDPVQRTVRQAIDNKTQQRLWKRHRASQSARQDTDDVEFHRSGYPRPSVAATKGHEENGHATQPVTVSISIEGAMDDLRDCPGAHSHNGMQASSKAAPESRGAPEVFVDLSSFIEDSGSAPRRVAVGSEASASKVDGDEGLAGGSGGDAPFRRRSTDHGAPQRLFTPSSNANRWTSHGGSGVQSAAAPHRQQRTRRQGGDGGELGRAAAMTTTTTTTTTSRWERSRRGGPSPKRRRIGKSREARAALTPTQAVPLGRLLTRAVAARDDPQLGDYDIRTGRRRRKLKRARGPLMNGRDASVHSAPAGGDRHGESSTSLEALRARRRESLTNELLGQLRRAAGEEEPVAVDESDSQSADRSRVGDDRGGGTHAEPATAPAFRPGGYAASFLRQRAVHVATGRSQSTASVAASSSVASSVSSSNSRPRGTGHRKLRNAASRGSFQFQRKGDMVVLLEEGEGASRERRFLALPAYDEHGRRIPERFGTATTVAGTSSSTTDAPTSIAGDDMAAPAAGSRPSPSRRAPARSASSFSSLGLPPRTPNSTAKDTPTHAPHGPVEGSAVPAHGPGNPSTGDPPVAAQYQHGGMVSGASASSWEADPSSDPAAWVRLQQQHPEHAPFAQAKPLGSGRAQGSGRGPSAAGEESDDARARRLSQTLLLDTPGPRAAGKQDVVESLPARTRGGFHRARMDPTRQSVGYYDEDGEEMESVGVDEDVDEDDSGEDEGGLTLQSQRSRSIASLASTGLPASIREEDGVSPPASARQSRPSVHDHMGDRLHAGVRAAGRPVAEHSRTASGDWGKDSLTGDEGSENGDTGTSRVSVGRASAVSETPRFSREESSSNASAAGTTARSREGRESGQQAPAAARAETDLETEGGSARPSRVEEDEDVHAGATIAGFPSRPPPGMAPVHRPWWQTLCACCGAGEAVNAPSVREGR